MYGLIALVPATGWVFWGILEAGDAGLVLAMLAHRTHGLRDRAVGVLAALAVTVAFVLAYTAAGGIGG